MSSAQDIPRLARAVTSSLSVSNSPTATFHSPSTSFSSLAKHNNKQRELKPFNREEFKILLLENVNQSGKDILSQEGYQVESLKSSLPEAELIEKIRYVELKGDLTAQLMTYIVMFMLLEYDQRPSSVKKYFEKPKIL